MVIVIGVGISEVLTVAFSCFFFMFNKLFFLFCVVAVIAARQVTVEVQVSNSAPQNGANLTPLWVAFHDGTFDSFNPGSSSSSALESIAEDGDTAAISALFNSQSSTFLDGTIPADSSTGE